MRDGLRNAADYISLLMGHEIEGAKALECFGDPPEAAEAERLFSRDFKAFVAEVRSVGYSGKYG